MRKALDDGAMGGPFGVDPGRWFSTSSDKIDALFAVEIGIAQAIDQHASDIVMEQRRSLYVHSALILVALSVMLAVAAWVSTSISRPLRDEVKVAEADLNPWAKIVRDGKAKASA